MARKIAFFIIPLFVSGLFCADETNRAIFKVIAKTSTNRIYIGDSFTLSVKISFHRRWKVSKPGPGLNLTPFEIIDYNSLPVKVRGDRAEATIVYKLSIFETGQFQIPSVMAAAFIGEKEIRSSSAPILIYVLSTTAEVGKEDIFEIKKQILPRGFIPTRYYLLLGAAILMLAILMGGIIWWRKRQKKNPPPLPPYEMALKAMQDLKRKDLLSQGKGKEFYYHFTLIIRSYLESKATFRFTKATTRQIKRYWKQRDFTHKAFYENLFNKADKIKFARNPISKTTTESYIEHFEEFLREDARKHALEKKQP